MFSPLANLAQGREAGSTRTNDCDIQRLFHRILLRSLSKYSCCTCRVIRIASNSDGHNGIEVRKDKKELAARLCEAHNVYEECPTSPPPNSSKCRLTYRGFVAHPLP